MTPAFVVCGQAFLGSINSRAVVAMVVVDTKPVILPNLHNDHMTNLKRQLREACGSCAPI